MKIEVFILPFINHLLKKLFTVLLPSRYCARFWDKIINETHPALEFTLSINLGLLNSHILCKLGYT